MSVPAHDLKDAAITQSIIGAFYEVYNVLGFGFLESVYVAALDWELKARGHSVGREIAVRIKYKGDEIAWQRMDFVVDGRVVVQGRRTHFAEREAPTPQLSEGNRPRSWVASALRP
jgi:GxxExxY protein